MEWKRDINPHTGHRYGYVGVENGNQLYYVHVDEDGWFYEYQPNGDWDSGYATAEKAMVAAEEDYSSRKATI